MSKPVKISTVLTRAAKYIEENGWTQHAFFKYRNGRKVQWSNFDDLLQVAREEGCPACARGALYAVDTEADPGERERRHSQALRYIEATGRLDVPFFGVAEWNDRSEATKDEVVQTLKDAAKAARKDGK